MSDPAEEERELRGLAASSALELVSTSYLAVEPDISGDIDDYSTDYALDVKGFLRAVKRAATEAESQLDQFIAAKLEGVQYYRHRDQIIRVGHGGTWKVKDADWLRHYLEEMDAWEIVNLFAPGSVTKTRLEQYLARRFSGVASAEALEGTIRAVVDRCMSREPSGGPITPLRLVDAPKKCQTLEHGQSIAAKPRLETGE